MKPPRRKKHETSNHQSIYYRRSLRADFDASKPKYYVLDMFPYPSSAGLHVGHPLGYIATDIAALALGARYIERHFTLDRTWKGTDHAASLEPDGMRRLARDVKHVGLTLTEKPQEILPVEQVQRDKLKAGQLKWKP